MSGRFGLRGAHRVVGFLGVLVFLLTGVYMKRRFPEAYAGDDGMRMMFRSAHVYILFSALLNLLLGAHLRERAGFRQVLNGAGSVLLLSTPLLCVAAFFLEPAPRELGRPFALGAAVVALTGTLLQVIAAREPAAR